jgi:hypothetical protein
MKTSDAKRAAARWVEANAAGWPGLRAAHVVGGVTSMADDAPFPADKDVDLHLVFAEGSPELEEDEPFAGVLEAVHAGVPIEAGVKSVADYRSPEAVLANPEIAHHLLGESIVHDPTGLLAGLQEEVRREYPRRRWVRARLDHERNGLAGAFALLPMARQAYGASGEVNLFGYTTTFASAALQVATLGPPRMGSRTFVRLWEALAAEGRRDLYEELVGVLGFSRVGPKRVEQVVREAAEAFDLAVQVHHAPGPFRHKLRRHLRPYLIDSCLAMLAEGHHREALAWATAVHLAAGDVLLDDGPEGDKPLFAFRQARLLKDLGLETAAARAQAVAALGRVHDRIFALADDIAARHPAIVD